MDPLTVLRIYLALRLHYTTKNYDIFKYNAAVKNINQNTLKQSVPRRMLVERLSKRFKSPSQVMGYLFPQWLYSNGQSLYDPSDSEDNYVKWQKFKANPNYYISRELCSYDCDELIMGDEPKILREVSKGNIAIESAIALQKVKPYLDLSKDYFVFNTMCNIIVKSTNFIKFDEDSVRMELNHEAA